MDVDMDLDMEMDVEMDVEMGDRFSTLIKIIYKKFFYIVKKHYLCNVINFNRKYFIMENKIIITLSDKTKRLYTSFKCIPELKEQYKIGKTVSTESGDLLKIESSTISQNLAL